MRKLARRFTYWLRRNRLAGELEEEMRLHVELRARKLHSQGVDRAGYAAHRAFGNRASFGEASREMWGFIRWERLLQDLRQAVRALRKTPAFTAAAVLTLAVGLGMNIAVFSVVNAVMIRRLPYPEPNRLVSIWREYLRNAPPGFANSGFAEVGAGGHLRTNCSVADLVEWQQRSHVFVGLAGYQGTLMNLTDSGTPDRIAGETVTANYFPLLGVQPALGRAILPEDDRPGAAAVVLVSDEFWRGRLGADTAVLGRSITLDAHPYQVIGVLPRGFEPPRQFGQTNRIEFWVPAAYSAEAKLDHGDSDIDVLARLRPGVSVRNAQAEMDSISAALGRQFQEDDGLRAMLAPLQDDLVRRVRLSLLALLGASGLIVLITCLNVANLMLVRAAARRHETSVRYALGASRWRILRQFLVESMVVAAAGCSAGILLGTALMQLLVRKAPESIPRIGAVSMDWRVFLVATTLATLAGIVFGLAPAWQASRTRPAESLKSASRSTVGTMQARGRAFLTVAEVALSLVLLIGAGLLLKSFVRLMGVDLGFQPDRVLVMNIPLPNLRYASANQRLQFFQRVEDRVQSLPGVQRVAFANIFPLRGGWSTGVRLDSAAGPYGGAGGQVVSLGYFETLGVPLLRGRLFTPEDHLGHPRVVIVNQEFARRFLPGADPIGHRLQNGGSAPWMTVIGVVNDIRRGGKDARITPQMYLPAAQDDFYRVRLGSLAVRSAGDPRQLAAAIQQQVWAVDKDQPVTAVMTLDETISASVAERVFNTLLLVIFAAVAVGLATVGVFGVLSYAVSQRTAELGLRVALGASPASILRLVLRQAGLLIACGVALGLAGAWALTRSVESLLFGVQRHDWTTYAAAVVLLSTVSIAAALAPARRGAKVDPIVALKYE